jgi:uncharacterized OsmC-like protein
MTGLSLVGLASCLTAGIAAVAQNRNIQLRSVTATLEGDMDVQGILGIDSEVRNGFGGIKVTYKIDAEAKREDIERPSSRNRGNGRLSMISLPIRPM